MDERAQTKADVVWAVTSGPALPPNAAAALAMAARMVGRVSSHLSNVISTVALPLDQVRSAPTWDGAA